MGQHCGHLLRLSNTSMDRGMVVLEQAWVFCLGDNLEDLEMGAMCAKKAVVFPFRPAFVWYGLELEIHVRAVEEMMVGRKESRSRRLSPPKLNLG